MKQKIRKGIKCFIALYSTCVVFGKNQIRLHRLKINRVIDTIFFFSFLYSQRLYNRRNINTFFSKIKKIFLVYLLSSHNSRILKSVGTSLPFLLAQIFTVLFRACACFTFKPGVTMEICVKHLNLPWHTCSHHHCLKPCLAQVRGCKWKTKLYWSSNPCVLLS